MAGLRLAPLALALALVGHATAQDFNAPQRGRDLYGQVLPFRGTNSCSASNCHNGDAHDGRAALDVDRPRRLSEATYWTTFDPHAKAYAVLFDERSKRMHAQFRRIPIETAAPQNDALCLGCHVQQQFETAYRVEDFSLEDGVGCESCHGAADQWLVPHVTNWWKTLAPEAKASYGYVPGHNAADRARMCVGCHVGAQVAEPGIELVDVNHDLIAAGHPRLAFEFASYESIYPKHWSDANRDASDPAHEIRSWVVGRLATSEGALRLLESRATHAAETIAAGTKTDWPEFAEYNCYACHHNLVGGVEVAFGRPGALPWGTWYHDASTELLGTDDVLGRLRSLMNQPSPDPGAVRAAVAQVLPRIRGTGDEWNARYLDDREIGPLADLSLRSIESVAEPTWDETTQAYLAFAALAQASKRGSGYHGELDAALDKVLSRVEFQVGTNTPLLYRDPSIKDDARFIRDLLTQGGY